MRRDEPRVRLDQFEGPLDLLLHLIRRHELEVSELAVAEVADQYLGFVRTAQEQAESVDVDEAAEYLVTAATLVEMKSRAIASAHLGTQRVRRVSEIDDDDPAAELVRSLLAYRAYRDAADRLTERLDEWDRRYGAARTSTDREALADAVREDDVVEDIELWDLVEAFRGIGESVLFDRLGDHAVIDEEVPLEVLRERLVEELREIGEGVSLAHVLRGKARGDMIGTFLALLELVRQRVLRVHRIGEGRIRPDDLRVELRHDGDEDAAESADAGSHDGPDDQASRSL